MYKLLRREISMGKKIIVAGAGHGGIAAGALLAKNGFDVTVYEKNKRKEKSHICLMGCRQMCDFLVRMSGLEPPTPCMSSPPDGVKVRFS